MSTTSHPPAFGEASAHIIALGRVIDQLELVEQRIREAEAERLVLLAEAFSIAAQESAPTFEIPGSEATEEPGRKVLADTDDETDRKIFEATTDVIPSGFTGKLAYRSVRAEISIALNQSEQTTERRLTHAFTLTRDYPNVLAQLQEGLLSESHTTVIVNAGAVIGLQNSPEIISRRRGYEGAVLKVAKTLTPNRLRPVARKLAEQFAELSIDERHAEACTHRRVYLVGRDDGMADVVAHLPAVEAYSVYDRVSQIAKDLAQRGADSSCETGADADASSSAGGSGSGSGDADTGSTGDADANPRNMASGASTRDDSTTDLGDNREGGGGSRTSQQGKSHGESVDSAHSRVRTRDEIRADVFADLLLNTDPASAAFGAPSQNGGDSNRGGASSQNGGALDHGGDSGLSGASDHGDTSNRDGAASNQIGDAQLNQRSHRSMFAQRQYRARVQVLLTDQDLFRLTNQPKQNRRENNDGDVELDEDEAYLAQLRAGPPPPVLAGYGPIDRESARRITKDASHWEMIRQREDSGLVLSVDRYRPSEEMRRFLGARDEHCRFPGCRVQLARCDIDHTVDAAKGGSTTTSNLAHLCRGHHILKHHTGWKVRQQGGGDLRWESPTNRTFLDQPESRVRFTRLTNETDPSDPAYSPMFADTSQAEPTPAERTHAERTLPDTESTNAPY